MAYQTQTEDSLWPTVVGLLAGAASKYLSDSWQKAHPGKVFPQAIGAGIGGLMMIGRNMPKNPYVASSMELAGAALFAGNIGDMVASNTVTLGNFAESDIPTQFASTTTTASPVRRRDGSVTKLPPGRSAQTPPPQNWNSWNQAGYTGS